MEYVSRCPACAALVRHGQDWCTLCHADLRPPPVRAARVEPVADEPVAAVDPVASVGEVGAVGPVGKHARRTADDVVRGTVDTASVTAHTSPIPEAVVAQMLAELAAESPDPVSGLMSRLPETQTMRVVLALVVGSVVALVLVFGSWLLGAIFG
jgi:hypothetical protein